MHGSFHDRHLHRRHAPSRCSAASCGSSGSNFSPSIDVRGPTAAAARTREPASPGESWKIRIRNRVRVEKQYVFGQIAGFGVGDQTVVNQWQPVPEGFEPLPPGDLLRGIELIKTAGFHRVEQFGEVVVELVENHIQPGAFGALCVSASPSSMLLFYSKTCSMTSSFPTK